MKPPPGYLLHYKWEHAKRLATYIGPHTSVNSKAPPMSAVALGKRKREESSSPAPDARRPKDNRQPLPDQRKKPTPAPRRPVTLGVRTSSRSAAAVFARRRATLGDESDTDLSDVPSDSGTGHENDNEIEDDSVDANELGDGLVKAEADATVDVFDDGQEVVGICALAEASDTPPRTQSPELCAPGLPTTRASPTPHAPPSPRPASAELVATDVIATNVRPELLWSSRSDRLTRPTLATAARQTAAESSSTSRQPGASGPTQSSSASHSDQASPTTSAAAGASSSLAASGSAGLGMTSGGSAGGDEDDEDSRRRFPMSTPMEIVDSSQPADEDDDEDVTMKDEDAMSVAGAHAPSEGGISLSGRDEGDKEAVNLLLFMFAGATASAAYDAAPVAAPAPSPAVSTFGPSPLAMPPSPPPGSSKASTTSHETAESCEPSSGAKRGAKRSAATEPTRPRSGRRNSAPLRYADEQIASTSASPQASTSKLAGKAKASGRAPASRTSSASDLRRGRAGPSSRPALTSQASGSGSSSGKAPSRDDSLDRRSTRRSEPIALDLRALMASKDGEPRSSL